MSAQTVMCVVIVCDGCGDELADTDTRATMHWPTRLAAVIDDGHHWTISTSQHGPDLCPACRCTRDGHDWEPLRGHRFIRACCARCGTFDVVAA
ncbi:hypothetical protein [Pseudonocardia sp. GCM10023141]|uniref:hypothetical protein n=1 Tax=Pseudonocardia sp. GCM10023141 TaxID=3252653 RepID=UPI0036177110